VKTLVKVDDYEVAEGLYYSKDWMWAKVEDGKVRIGITDYAQKQLNEVVFAELPSVGDEVMKDQPFGTVESVKSVSDLTAPVSGTIEEVNNEITDSPEIVNDDPYNKGWLIIVAPTNLEEDLKTLMTFEASVKWHEKLAKES
jgi:glycine cleavage system H protein